MEAWLRRYRVGDTEATEKAKKRRYRLNAWGLECRQVGDCIAICVGCAGKRYHVQSLYRRTNAMIGLKTTMPGELCPASRCSRRCGGIDLRLLVTSRNECVSHQSRISGSRVPFTGAPGIPTVRTGSAGSRRMSSRCKRDPRSRQEAGGWSRFSGSDGPGGPESAQIDDSWSRIPLLLSSHAIAPLQPVGQVVSTRCLLAR